MSSDRSKKRKRQPSSGGLQRSVSGSAFVACPVCSRQVPLATINVHLNGMGCCPDVSQHDLQNTASRDVQHTPAHNACQNSVASAAAPAFGPPLIQHSSRQSCAQQENKTEQNAQPDGSPAGEKPLALAAVTATAHCVQKSITPDSVPESPPQDTVHIQYLPVPHAELLGEYVIQGFVSPAEESALIRLVDTALPAWKDSNFNGKHRGKRWGAEMDLGKRTVQPGTTPMPAQLTLLINRMQSIGLLKDFVPNEANAIDYQKCQGHWLKPHVDDRQLSTNKIVTLSLGCAATMTFSCSKRRHQVAIKLPACALQVITQHARYMYAHGISNADLEGPRRVSITFRQSPMKG